MRSYNDDSIKTIGGLEHMRTHSGMWSFERDTQQGLYQMIKEVYDNSVDESSALPDKHHVINITFLRQPNTYQVIIEDSGRGVPLNKLHDSFMELFTSAKSDKAYNMSIGTYGVGVKATTALSRILSAVSTRGEGSASIVSNRAKCIDRQIVKSKNKDKSQFGTVVMFEPDTNILSQTRGFFDENGGFYTLIELINFICMIRKNVTTNVYVGKGKILDKDLTGKKPNQLRELLVSAKDKCKLEYVSSNDTTPVEYLIKDNGITSPIIWKTDVLSNTTGDPSFNYHVELFITKDYTQRSGQYVTSVNAIRMFTKDTDQMDCLIKVLKKYLNQFIEDDDIKRYFMSSYNLPIHMVALAWHNKASFDTQKKVSYKSAEFSKLYTKALDKQFKELGTDYWDNLYTMLSDDIETKYHKYNNRGLNLGGSMKNLAYSLNKPGSYCACREKDPEKTELFIVEGDSAMTTIKQICDRETQAIWMLGGKPLNPFKKKDYSVVRKNESYQDLIKVIGVSPGDTDLSNMNFKTISILADADPDGYHISALVIGILYSINPLILTEKRVRLSTPPLYIMSHRIKHKSLFVRDKKALMDARSETASRLIDVKLKCGDSIKLLDEEEFRSMYYLIHRVGTTIESVAKRLAIQPGILEMFMHCLPYLKGKVDAKAISKKLNLDFCKHIEANNSLVMTVGAVEYVVPLNNVVSDISGLIIPELGPLAFDKIELMVSTKLTDLYKDHSVTLTELYHIFKQINELFNTSRMKGLGQMPKPVLKQTCLDQATRSFVTLTSLGDVEDLYRVLGVDTQARKDLVSKFVGGEDDDYLL